MSVEMGHGTRRDVCSGPGATTERWSIEGAMKAAGSELRIRPGWYQKFGSPATGTDAIRVLADGPPTDVQRKKLGGLGLSIGKVTDETDTFGGYLVNIDLAKKTPVAGSPGTSFAAPHNGERPYKAAEPRTQSGRMLAKSDARAVAERVIGMRSGGYSDKFMFAEPGTVGIIGVCDKRPGREQVKELESHGLHVSSVEKGPFEKTCSVYITIGSPAMRHEIRQPSYKFAERLESRAKPADRTARLGGDTPGTSSGPPPPEKQIHRDAFCVMNNATNLANRTHKTYQPANPGNHGIIVTCERDPEPMIRDRLKCIGLVIRSIKKHPFAEKWTVHVEILPHEGRRRLDDVPLPKKWDDIMDRVRKHMDLVHGLFDTYYPSGLDSNGIIVTTTDRPSQSQKHALEADGLIVRSVKKVGCRDRCNVMIEVVPQGRREPASGTPHPMGPMGHEDAIIQIKKTVKLASPSYETWRPLITKRGGIIVTLESEPDFAVQQRLEMDGLIINSVKRHRFGKKCTVWMEIMHDDEIRARNNRVREKKRSPDDVFGRIGEIIFLAQYHFGTYEPVNPNSSGIVLWCSKRPDYTAEQLLEKDGMILRSVTRGDCKDEWTAYVEILSHAERRRRQGERVEEKRGYKYAFCEIKRSVDLYNMAWGVYIPANLNSNGIIVTCNSEPDFTTRYLLEKHGLIVRHVEKHGRSERYTVHIEILSKEELSRRRNAGGT